jgi:hypothetical protein
MTTLVFAAFVLTALDDKSDAGLCCLCPYCTVKKVAPHGAETTKVTLVFAAFVLTALLKRWRLMELRRQ